MVRVAIERHCFPSFLQVSTLKDEITSIVGEGSVCCPQCSKNHMRRDIPEELWRYPYLEVRRSDRSTEDNDGEPGFWTLYQQEASRSPSQIRSYDSHESSLVAMDRITGLVTVLLLVPQVFV